MLFSRDKDDDDDFIPNPNYHSNLASIFGNTSSDGNSTLTYTAPKQPKRQSRTTTIAATSTSSASSSSVVIAKTVQTFKMVDGAYQNQGKVGAAVVTIGTPEGTFYQLLLYRDKRHHLCSTRITKEFNFHIQPKNYCTFYDKQAVIWSILFDSALEIIEFALQVAIAKWRSGDPTTPIMFQDLWCPVSDDAKACVAAVGDTVELNYTLHTISSSSQGMEKSQSVSVEVEAAGWKQGLIGTQASTKRVIMLQPFMLGDLNPNEVAFNSPVVVKVSVVQVSKPDVPLPPDLLRDDNKNTIKEPPKQQSVPTESSGSPKVNKADLITRMARMGQALPFKTAAPTPSDSDDTEEDPSGRQRSAERAVPKPRTRVQHSTALPPAPLCTVVGGNPALPPPIPISQPVQWATSPYMVSNMYPVPQMQSPVDTQSQFNMFFSEVRTTNSELRMGITRLTDKVEALQTKFDTSEQRPGQDTTAVIERLIATEENLKTQLQVVLSALQNNQMLSPNRASGEPPTPTPEPCHRCEDLRQDHASMAEKLKRLEEENEYLQTKLSAQQDALQNAKCADQDQLTQIESLNQNLEEEQKTSIELSERLKVVEREKELLAKDLGKANNTIVELQNTVQEKQTGINKLEQALRDSEATKIEEVRRNLQEVLDPKPLIGEHVRKIMNAVYRLVRVQFEPQSKYDASFIQSVLAETIKAVTLEYLNGDVVNSEAQPLSPTAPSHSQPAPSVSSHQDTIGQQLKVKRNHECSSEETKLPADNCTEVRPETSASPHQGTSSAGPSEEAQSVHNANENDRKNENALRSLQGEANIEVKSSEPQAEPTPPSVDSFDNVWRHQPPPPPLFDEIENNDDWFNS